MKLKVGPALKIVPPGRYCLIVKEIQKSETYKRPCFAFSFEIAEGDHKGTVLKGFCNADYRTFSDRTKLYQWYRIAVREDELQPGIDEIETDYFLNKIFEAVIETKVSRRTKMEFSNVTELIRLVREI